MKSPILLPTPELIEAAIRQFDERDIYDRALAEMLGVFPSNESLPQVLLKVVCLNRLYSTHILDVEGVAHHIVNNVPDFDQAVSSGLPDVVDRIAHIEMRGRVYNFFSFASKFCSWHNPACYPIYDTRVEDYLWRLNKIDCFQQYKRDSYTYPEFLIIVNAFRAKYQLEKYSFKQLDKFFYMTGELETDTPAPTLTVIFDDAITPGIELIVEVGAEGGSIKLLRITTDDKQSYFQLMTDETSLAEVLSPEDLPELLRATSPIAESFVGGLKLLDRYRWFEMHPMYVHPSCLQTVLAVVEERGSDGARERWKDKFGSVL